MAEELLKLIKAEIESGIPPNRIVVGKLYKLIQSNFVQSFPQIDEGLM